MNKQDKGDGRRGIEWCDYTHNPIAGCLHGCRWEMPSGDTALCYAEHAAENGSAVTFYPEGFAHHYWHPDRVDEPLKLKKPARIFVGSMADVYGHWVPSWQIQAVLDVCRQAYWHTFKFLSKNPVRMKDFCIPDNCWMGASSPPDFMWGKRLSRGQQVAWLRRTLGALAEVKAPVRWMSIEPLSFDIVEVFEQLGDLPLAWVVIGAASNGPVYYQPDPDHLRRLIGYLNDFGIPFFLKGNLRPSFKVAFNHWYEDYPVVETLKQQPLFEMDE